MMSDDEILKRVEEIKARGNSPAREAPDPVNVPMIRHWAEAIGDTNPRWAPGPDTEAPPAMAQVWTMYGLNPERMPGDPLPDTMSIFDEAGYTSVLGTNCDQTYARTLRARRGPADQHAARRGRRPQEDRRRRGLVHHDAEHLDRRRRGGRDDDVPRPQVQARHRPRRRSTSRSRPGR